MTDIHQQLRDRISEWKEEQTARIKAEQQTIAADERTRQLLAEMERIADRLDHIPNNDEASRAAAHDIAATMRTVVVAYRVAMGEHVPGVIRCGPDVASEHEDDWAPQ